MFSLALVFVALAAVAAGSGYIPGREYVYRYHGHVFSGFPDRKAQYAGHAYDSVLTVQPKGEYAVFKVGNVRYAAVNGEVENFDEHPYNYIDLPDRAEFMTRPFKVYFRNGQVTQFQVSKDEPAFSVNMKRGLISLFHLNFEEAESPSLTEKDNEIYRPDYSSHYYRTYEDGVLGQCETQYVIEHHPYHLAPHNNIVLNVTKTRNYHKCSSSPSHHYSTFYGNECGKSDYEKAHTLHGNGRYYYNIRGDRHHYVIEHVNTEGEIAYTPYPLEGQSATVYSNRSLDLLEERETQQDFEPSGALDTFYSLLYDIPFRPEFKAQVDLKKPHYLYHIFGRKAEPAAVKQLFEELVTVYDDKSYTQKAQDKNFPSIFLELVRAFSTLGYEDINALYKEYADFEANQITKQKAKERSLFYDVLVSTGTNPVILFQKYLIQNGKVTPQIAQYFVQHVQQHVKEVTEVLLDELHELCEDSYVKSHYNVYATCYLALSNIVYDSCVARYHPESRPEVDAYVCPDDVPVKFFNHIAQLYDQTDDEYLRVAYIKAAGNIGVRESLRYLRPYVEGQGDYSLYLRTTAIWALKNTGIRYPELVRELLVPVYYNRSENYEIRLSAFTLLLSLHPGVSELETIAKSLVREEDDQVRSYVYSNLKEYANSTHPCNRQLAADARYALAALRRYEDDFEKYDYSFSHVHYVSGYDSDYDYGGSTRWVFIASDSGYVPRTLYLGLNDYLGGKSLNTFGVGFKQRGLEKFVDKILGPEGAYGKRSLFDLFKKRGKRDISNVEKERKEIHEKLQVPTKDYEPIQGEIFFKYMGNHISYIYFNDSTFESFFKEGGFRIPNYPARFRQFPEFTYQRFLLALDKLYMIPSEAGLPILFDYKQPTYFFHDSDKLQIEVNPSFFKGERQNQLPTDVQVKVDGHFIFDKNLYASVGVQVPFDQITFGAGINRRATVSLPIKAEFTVDLKESKFNAKWTPVVPHEIYHFHYEPYTFIDSYGNTVPVSHEQYYRPVRRNAYTQEVQKDFFYNYLGVGLTVHKNFDNEWNDKGSWLKFFTEKDYREKFYYLYANPQFEPYEYNFTLQAADSDPTNEVEAEFQYHCYRGDENIPEPEFADSGFEEYGRSRTGKDFIVTVLNGEIVAKGQKERKVQAHLTYSRNIIRTYHKLNVYYQRTPFARYENDDVKLCFSGYLKYPTNDMEKIFQMNTIGVDRTAESKIKVHFGKDCTSDQKFVVQSKYELSEEQKYLESKREEPEDVEHYNPYAHLYQKCLKEYQQWGFRYTPSCVDYIYYAYNVHKYTHHVKFENLSPGFLNFTYKIAECFRHKYFYHGEHNYIGVQNPEDEIHIEKNVSVVYPVADFRISKPRSESVYTHVYVPEFKPFVAYPFYYDMYVKKSLNKHYCVLENDVVTSFDRYTYKLPPIDCYTVFAKDCSPNDHYVILTSKINHPKYSRAMKVIFGKHKVEALPVSDDSGIIVRVDGKKIVVSESEIYQHFDQDSKKPVFIIYTIGSYYSLLSEKYGFEVAYDGNALYHEVSVYYRNKLCGLCGNYNGQRYDGLEAENGCYYPDTDGYAYSYAIPSDTCNVPKTEYVCHGEHGAGCTDLKTHVIPLNSGKVPQTCFSTEPVPVCREGCVPKGHVTKNIGYHCLPSKDDSTKKLLRQQQVRVLYEIRRKSRDHETDVEFPEGCYRE